MQSKNQEEQDHHSQTPPPSKEKGFSKTFLKQIDESITNQIMNQINQFAHIRKTPIISLTQKEVFDHFCQQYAKDILQECLYQKERNINHEDVLDTIVPRLKKTVKNRYYNIRTAISRYSEQKNME